jgi:hypothetical protein
VLNISTLCLLASYSGSMLLSAIQVPLKRKTDRSALVSLRLEGEDLSLRPLSASLFWSSTSWFVSTVVPFCGIRVLVNFMTQALRAAHSFAFIATDGLSITDLPIRLSCRFTSEVGTPSGKKALSRDALSQQRFVLEHSCERYYMMDYRY